MSNILSGWEGEKQSVEKQLVEENSQLEFAESQHDC
jgi:hypothetical protein